MDSQEKQLETVALGPMTRTSLGWYAWVAFLLAIVLSGFVAYLYQVQNGLAVTAMRDTVIWGLYITNFVFFIGISHAGTLISAILRVTQAEWRRPVTRLAEFIPVIALARDRLKGKINPLRWRLYAIFALGWHGAPEQRETLERAISIMMLLIIPIAVSVHTVVSWLFAMTLRAGWNSTIFGPYFVVGAIYSGIAGIITIMYIFRRVYHLGAYITEKHFHYLGYLLLTLGVIYFYFTFAEYL